MFAACLLPFACDDYSGYSSRKIGDVPEPPDASIDSSDASGGSHDAGTDSSDGPNDSTGDSAGGDAEPDDARGDGDAPLDGGPDAPPDGAASDGSQDGPITTGYERVLWNDGKPGSGAAVLVCFTKEPHNESGARVCRGQTASNRACDGEAFESHGTSAAVLRKRVEVLVRRSWQRYANLEFYGWVDCDTSWVGMPGIVQVTFVSPCQPDGGGCVQSEPSSNEVRGPIGKSATQATDVHIDWTALRDGRNDRGVIHQFGHALGFAHSGVGAACPASAYEHDIDELYGAPLTKFFNFENAGSIMNPCRLGSAEAELSAADVLGLQSWYGRIEEGQIKNDLSECMNMGSGFSIVPYTCRADVYSTWRRDWTSTAEQLRADLDGTPLCLDVTGGTVSPTQLTPITAANCAAVERQRFTTTSVQWLALGNLCIGPSNPPAGAPGSALSTVPCKDSAARWDFNHPGTELSFGQIRLTGSNLCVTGQTLAGTYGEPLTLANCDKSDERQVFISPGRGALEYRRFTGWQVTAPGLEPAAGIPIVLTGTRPPLFTPYDAQFHLSGSITALGQCATSRNGQVVMLPCAPGEPGQNWDYYFGARN
jgi:hypothetical protein